MVATVNRFIKIYPDLKVFARELLFMNCLSRFKQLEAKMIRRSKCLRFVDYFVPCFFPCKYNTNSQHEFAEKTQIIEARC